jgi:hypothetical protein
MRRLILVGLLSFAAMHIALGQEKKDPVRDSVQQNKSTKQIIKSELDTTLNTTKKKVEVAKKQLTDQKNKVTSDVKEIYQTVFITRDTSVLKEQTLEISKELDKESKKLKSSVQGLTSEKAKESLLKEGAKELNEVKDVAGDQKEAIQSTVEKVNLESVEDGAKKEGQQQINQLKSEKDNLKNELKKPVDFDLSVDNNGTETKSLQLDNLKQKSGELKDFKIDPNKPDTPTGILPGLNAKSLDLDKQGLEDKVPDLDELGDKVLEGKDKIPESKSVEKLRNTIERVGDVDGKEAKKTIAELTNVKTILSQKQKARLLDSLGLKKFDSLYAKANPYLKKEVGKEELLNELNKSFLGQSNLSGPAMNETGMRDAVKNELVNESKEFNPLTGKLPQSVLGGLSPLSGSLVDSKYVKLVDSLRSIKLKEQGMTLDERELSEQGKEIVLKKKPKFWDKTYGDIILGVLHNENTTIMQVSPSLGYHILPLFSIGLGPMISVQKQDSIYNTKVGLRSFAKVELFKQRAYIQAEYQLSPYQIQYKDIKINNGNVLLGCGIVKKVYGHIAINAALLYKVYNNDSVTSPWVFRLGLSTVKVNSN